MDRIEADQNIHIPTQNYDIEEYIVAEAAEVIELEHPKTNMCLARQPIFDASMEVSAYELLYSSADLVAKEVIDGNTTSSQVMINAFLDVGIEAISDNRTSFIKVTRDFLVGKLPLPFPPKSIVLEISPDLHMDEELKVGLQYFIDKGFVLALDDYTVSAVESPLLEYVDIVMVNINTSARDALASGLHALERYGVKPVAQHVDTRADLDFCKSLGFELFQGAFISEPMLVSGKVLKPSRIALIKIIKLLEDPDCDIAVLEVLISQDITLSYKILRIINSAFYGFRRKIDSVKQAVVSLGLKVIRDWFIVISLTDIDDKPQELIFLTLQRARMMQSLADFMCMNKDTGFTIGLFSSIDAIMDQPMETILQALPLSSEITEALLEKEGTLGKLLDIVLHYEKGDWSYINNAGFETSELSTFYFEAMFWARGLFEQIKSDDDKH